MVHIVRGDNPRPPVTTDAESPARAFHSYEFSHLTETKVDRGDMGEVSEVSDGFWEVVSKRRFVTAELES